MSPFPVVSLLDAIHSLHQGGVPTMRDLTSISLKTTNEGWSKIIDPNTLNARLVTRKGLQVPQVPNVTKLP